MDRARGALERGKAVVASSLQVAIVGSYCSLQLILSHNIFLKFQHAIMKRKNQIPVFRKMFIFSLKLLEARNHWNIFHIKMFGYFRL